jgi:Domain of unknown function (DUF4331)
MQRTLNYCLAAAVAAAGLCAGTARAADHRETPTTIADAVADIADVYTWKDGSRFVIAMTVDGLRMPTPGQTSRFDEDVRYELHIGRDAFATTRQSAVDIVVRMKQQNGQWTVLAQNVPGANGTISGDAESVITKGTAKLFVGLRDDPFFFDLEGFRNTLMTGTLMFNPARDTFAGMNATAIVIEMDLNAVASGSNKLYIWGTTARKDG